MPDRLLSPQRALLCVAAGLVAGTVAAVAVAPRLGPLVAWCTAAGVALVWVWLICWPQDASGTERLAREESVSHLTDDAIIAACLASIAGVVVALMQSGNQNRDAISTALVVLGVLGTMVAWAMVNTVYAFKYARMYYLDQAQGGLDFKQEARPTYSDFAYFAFTIGMSFAVSEVEPTSSDTRRRALPHALLSYLFGTVLIAVAINLVTNLGQG
jgi:uncharacterized membrane protein